MSPEHLATLQRELFQAPVNDQPELFQAYCQAVVKADQDGEFKEADAVTLITDSVDEVYDAVHGRASEQIVYAWLVLGDQPWLEPFLPALEIVEQLENPYFNQEREQLWQTFCEQFSA